MLNIPEEIKGLFRSDNTSQATTKKFKLTFYDDTIDTLYPYETLFPDESLFPAEHGEPWLTIENNRIESESLSITESLSESEDLEFGSCEATSLEIIVADVIEDITEKEFTLTVEIGGYEMALGIYTVESFVRQADRRKRKITAYDRMRWFNTDVSDWYNNLVFPLTLKTFRDSLCDYIGIQQEQTNLLFDSMEITKTIEPSQMSGLDVLKAICQINGCFGHVDKTGQLTYIRLQQTGLYPSEDLFPYEELYPSEFGGDGQPTEIVSTYKSMIYEDYLVDGITGLNIREQEGDIGASVGESDNVYAVEGNFLVYGKTAIELLNIAESLLPIISGRIYRPATIECNAMPWVEVGDVVIAPTRDDIVETFVMSRTIKGCQAMMDTIESTGSQKREEVFGINKQIIQLEGKAAIITKNVEEVSVRVTDLKNYTEAQFKVTAESITAEVTRAKGEEEKLSSRITVNADSITSEVTRATAAEGQLSTKITQTATEIRQEVTDTKNGLQSQITQNANAITLKVSKGDVTSQLNSELKITGNSIALTTGHFTVTSKNLTIDSSGNATFSGALSAATGSFSGSITGGSININNVFKVDSAGNTSITGNHFTWSATNSSMASDGTITCKNIKATSGTFTGNITGSAITGSSIETDVFYADDTEIVMGDFSVSADESNSIYSSNGYVIISEGIGTGGTTKYGQITVTGAAGTTTTIKQGVVNCADIYITGSSEWSSGWSLGTILDYIWNDDSYGLYYCGHQIRSLWAHVEDLESVVG